jgi:hypothetical protein
MAFGHMLKSFENDSFATNVGHALKVSEAAWDQALYAG